MGGEDRFGFDDFAGHVGMAFGGRYYDTGPSSAGWWNSEYPNVSDLEKDISKGVHPQSEGKGVLKFEFCSCAATTKRMEDSMKGSCVNRKGGHCSQAVENALETKGRGGWPHGKNGSNLTSPNTLARRVAGVTSNCGKSAGERANVVILRRASLKAPW